MAYNAARGVSCHHPFSMTAPRIGVLAGWQIYWTARPLSYLNPIFRGIRQAAADLGCNLLLGCGLGPTAASSDPLRPAWPFPSPETDFVPIGPWNTDGLIAINPLHSEARSRDLQQVRAAGHPVQFIGSGEDGPTIVADNAGGILAAMKHLVEHGHLRIAFIAGSPEDLSGDTGARLMAYRAALERHGLAADERLVAYGQHVYDVGYAAMRQIIGSGAAFTAVVASNDESAFGVQQALRDAGLQMPQDVAVIGFDDRPECAVQEPALTSVHIPLFKMGYRAVELLLRQMRGRRRAGRTGTGRHPPRPARIVRVRLEPAARGSPRDAGIGGPGKSAGRPACAPGPRDGRGDPGRDPGGQLRRSTSAVPAPCRRPDRRGRAA